MGNKWPIQMWFRVSSIFAPHRINAITNHNRNPKPNPIYNPDSRPGKNSFWAHSWRLIAINQPTLSFVTYSVKYSVM